jgi:Cof subfamily protein (haloacid dehalogenase superfamily)
MDYKAIISDFDGTLAMHDLVLTSRLKNVLGRLKKKGWHFCIATGRSFTPAFKKLCEELPTLEYVVVDGGAEIIKAGTWQSQSKYLMDATVVGEFIEFCDARNITVLVYSDDIMYLTESEIPNFSDRYTCKLISQFKSQELGKIRTLYTNETEEYVAAAMHEASHMFPSLHIIGGTAGAGMGYDVTSLHATKHQAVLHLTEMLGLHPDEVVGIGDGYNDYPLLTASGLKVAIEGAPQELIDIADKVVPSQATDGVATFFESLL